jgi:hypothetical protein
MFMRAPSADAEPLPKSPPLTRAVLAITVAGLLVLGVYPNWVHRVTAKGLPRVEAASPVGLSGLPIRPGK